MRPRIAALLVFGLLVSGCASSNEPTPKEGQTRESTMKRVEDLAQDERCDRWSVNWTDGTTFEYLGAISENTFTSFLQMQNDELRALLVSAASVNASLRVVERYHSGSCEGWYIATADAETSLGGRVEENVTVPVSFDGLRVAGAFVCLSPNPPLPCTGTPIDYSKTQRRFGPANYTRINVTLYWNETSPTTHQMNIGVWNETKASDGTLKTVYLGAFAAGPSPLHLDAVLRPHDPRSVLLLSVSVANLAPPPEDKTAYLRANPDQPFHAEGQLTITGAS